MACQIRGHHCISEVTACNNNIYKRNLTSELNTLTAEQPMQMYRKQDVRLYVVRSDAKHVKCTTDYFEYNSLFKTETKSWVFHRQLQNPM